MACLMIRSNCPFKRIPLRIPTSMTPDMNLDPFIDFVTIIIYWSMNPRFWNSFYHGRNILFIMVGATIPQSRSIPDINGDLLSNDNVMKWKNFPRYWPVVQGITGHRWIPLTKASDAALWCLHKSLNKQSWGWLFEASSHSLWRQCNDPKHFYWTSVKLDSKEKCFPWNLVYLDQTCLFWTRFLSMVV